MSATSTTTGSATIDRPKAKKKQESLPEIFLNMGKAGLKVFAAYVVILTILTLIHFPYHADEEAPPKIKKESGTFYADIYAAPKTSSATTAVTTPTAAESRYVQIAAQVVKQEGNSAEGHRVRQTVWPGG